MSNTMRATQFHSYGEANVLVVDTVPRPVAHEGELLVRVHASSVNPIDTIVRSGKLSFQTGKQFPKRIGIDFAGEIVAPTDPAAAFKKGDRVWGVMPLTVEKGVGQGSNADYVTISAERLAVSPKSLSFVEAASISSVGAVAMITLRDKAQLKAGERILIRGAAGGVGTMAVQYASLLGADITVLAGAKDLAFLHDLGAKTALDYRTTDTASLGKFDVILDLVGADLGRYRRHLSDKGRMFCLAPGSLGNIIYIAASAIFGQKRVRFFSAAPMGDTMKELANLVDAGSIRPIVHSVYDLNDIAVAHQSIEQGGGRGNGSLLI